MKKAALAALLAVVTSAACGGGGGSNSPPPNNPPPGGNQNVCATADTAEDPAAIPPSPSNPEKRSGRVDGSNRWRVLDALYAHRQARARGFLAEAAVTRDNVDIGEIAVVQDDGDLILAANPYDLRDLGLHFTRNGGGGYDVRRIDGAFRTAIGQRLNLSDDDTRQANVPFSFSFYGQAQTTAFVNSDGNVTFGEGDSASLDRSVARLLTGPPRVSPFFADLDPSAGGNIFVNAASDQYTVTWCGVRGFDDTRTTTVQATLLPNGAIEMKYGASIALPDAVVGVSPGRTQSFTPVNLSDQGPTAGGAAAVGERFASTPELDIVAAARKFYQTHEDRYDQFIIWTDETSVPAGTFAFETTVKNEIRGIGLDQFDFANEFGSAGALRSLAIMDSLNKYPPDPNTVFLGANTTLSVLGQEAGHRWLAFMNFRDHTGAQSDALLGRDGSHWSFFFNSNGSVMEGNDIRDLGGGSFETGPAVQRYSRLDQYAMGLATESEVPTFFYVDSPTNVSRPNIDRESPPARDRVTFNGTKRDVLIGDIVQIHGSRSPVAGSAIGTAHRQAFIYIVSRGRSPEESQVSKLDRIRTSWETFFRQATENRMTARTALR